MADDLQLSTFEQLPCEGCGFRGSACTCTKKVVPPVQYNIQPREKVLDELRNLRRQVGEEADAVALRIARDQTYQKWLIDYGSALDSSIYALTPPEVKPA